VLNPRVVTGFSISLQYRDIIWGVPIFQTRVSKASQGSQARRHLRVREKAMPLGRGPALSGVPSSACRLQCFLYLASLGRILSIQWHFSAKAANGEAGRGNATSIHQMELGAPIEDFTQYSTTTKVLGRRNRI
jgi:hypothetical protein